MHERLLAAVGNRTYRHIGELTGTHPETVRRYLSGQSPSVEFIAAVSTALNINADWLISGRGPMKCEELKAHALATADTSELLHAMSETIVKLIDRVELVEVYIQTLETRVRVQQTEELASQDPARHITSPPGAVSSPLNGGVGARTGTNPGAGQGPGVHVGAAVRGGVNAAGPVPAAGASAHHIAARRPAKGGGDTGRQGDRTGGEP